MTGAGWESSRAVRAVPGTFSPLGSTLTSGKCCSAPRNGEHRSERTARARSIVRLGKARFLESLDLGAGEKGGGGMLAWQSWGLGSCLSAGGRRFWEMPRGDAPQPGTPFCAGTPRNGDAALEDAIRDNLGGQG